MPGNGSFSLIYLGDVTFIGTIEVYSGSGSKQMHLSLYESGEDPDVDCIDLEDISYSGGDSIDGDYSGEGAYDSGSGKDIGTGTFTATRC